MVLKFDNGNFISVSEGPTRLGATAVSLGTGPSPVTTTVIPAKNDQLFLKLVAEKTSTTTKGISIVSCNLQNEITPEIAKTLIAEITEMVRNV